MIRVLCLLIVAVSAELQVKETTVDTIPMPVDGWLDKSPRLNLPLVLGDAQGKTPNTTGAVVVYPFRVLHDTYEPMVRRIQSEDAPAVICLVGAGHTGDLFRVTDGKRQTADLVTPVVMLPVSGYMRLQSLAGNSSLVNVTFPETNWHVYYDRSPAWNILLSFPTVLSLAVCLLGPYHLFLYARYKVPFDNPHIALIAESIAGFLRFLNCLDLVGSRLLFPYWMSRSLTTLYFPLSMGTAFLITAYMGALIRKNTHDTRTFLERKWLKVTCAVAFCVMLSFEIVSQIGIRLSPAFGAFITATFVVYDIAAVAIAVLYVTGTVIVVRKMRLRMIKVKSASLDDDTSLLSRARQWLTHFLWRYLTSSVGYAMVAVSITVLFAKFSGLPPRSAVLVGRMTSFFTCTGFSIAAIAHVFAYRPSSSARHLRSKSSDVPSTQRTEKSDD